MTNKFIAGSLLVLFLSACDVPPTQRTSEEIQNKQQEIVNKHAVQSVGMPSIKNFAEKRLLKDIYELRDRSISTVTYTKDMNGHAHKFCESVGFAIPFAAQYTSPERPALGHETEMSGNIVLPQADPNGIYSPSSAEGTWVMCIGKKSRKMHPVYIEDRVFVVVTGEEYDGLL